MTQYVLATTIVASFVLAANVSAEVPTVSHGQLSRRAYEACLSSEATNGSYTAADGGISALRLMDQCTRPLAEWRLDCVATGQTLNQCNLLAVSYAQALLEQREHLSKP
jgi:hypothetical protein